MNVIILNGPPGCGKDTLANQLTKVINNSVSSRFKNVLYRRMAEKHNLELGYVIAMCNDRDLKDIPSELFEGLSPRQELINISENEIKVKYGQEGVATKTLMDMLDIEDYGRKTFVFSDGGFPAEVSLLKRVLKRYGLVNFILVRINKDGCTFEGDSRNYIDNPNIVITNNEDESHLEEAERGKPMLEQFLKKFGQIFTD